MNDIKKKQLREKLEQEKAEIEHRLEQTGNYGMETSMNASIGELSGYDNHPADLGTELFERGKDLALNENDERQLADIKTALQRMDRGTYGYCEVCGQEISVKRLEAVPATRYCIHHQPDRQPSMRRPVEEKVLRPDYYNNDEKDRNIYDGEDAWQEVEQYGTSNPPDFFVEGRDYNELTIDHNESRGYIDLMEGFSITDFSGHTDETTGITHSDAYYQKEREEMAEEQGNDELL